MDRAAYFIWLLLPLALGLLCLWSQAKRSFKMQGQEDPKDYFKQFLFVVVGYALALGIDKGFGESALDAFPDQEENIGIARWLIYPAILLGMAYLLGIRDKQIAAKEKAEKAKRHSPGRGA